MYAFFLTAQGIALAALISLMPEEAPPDLWIGVLICLLAAPLIAFLEHCVRRPSNNNTCAWNHAAEQDDLAAQRAHPKPLDLTGISPFNQTVYLKD